MNKLLNYIAQVFFLFFSSIGGVFRAFCCAVWQWYTKHQTGNAPKPPFYSSSTKQFSCNGLNTGPVAETLHEQDTVIESRESRIDIVLGTRKGRRAVQGTTDEKQELQAAENRHIWITSSEGTPEKRPNYKGTLEASQPRWLSHHA